MEAQTIKKKRKIFHKINQILNNRADTWKHHLLAFGRLHQVRLWNKVVSATILFQWRRLLVGHGRHKASYHVPWQASTIIKMFFAKSFVVLYSLLLFPFTLMRTGMVFMRQIENSAPETMSRMETSSKKSHLLLFSLLFKNQRSHFSLFLHIKILNFSLLLQIKIFYFSFFFLQIKTYYFFLLKSKNLWLFFLRISIYYFSLFLNQNLLLFSFFTNLKC